MTEDLIYYNKVYSESAEYKKEPTESRYYHIWTDIVKMVSDKEEIIEIGCGSGQLAKLLMMNGKNYYHGFDYSEEAIKIARELNPGKEDFFSVDDIYTFKQGDFDGADVIICTEVLEHLDDDQYLFWILKPGTRIIFSLPDFMCKTHRRAFKSIDEVRDWYSDVNIIKAITHKTKGGNKIFLIDAIVK
jgi:2-polyprenyl-3-methyl-5-hydroxy-6-metoxy-1,4-benzoquinol methylase